MGSDTVCGVGDPCAPAQGYEVGVARAGRRGSGIAHDGGTQEQSFR